MMQAKTGLDEEGLVLVYDGHRIMLGATPQALRIRKDTSTKIGQWLTTDFTVVKLTNIYPLRCISKGKLGRNRS